MRIRGARRPQQRWRFLSLLVLSMTSMQFFFSLRFWGGATSSSQPDSGKIDSRLSSLQQKTSLRWDWTNLERRSELARLIDDHQRNCNLPLANFRYRNRFGLGSDLHVYSLAICNALEAGSFRVRTAFPWIWLDRSTATSFSAMASYFPSAELQCPDDRDSVQKSEQLLFNMTRGRGRLKDECPSLRATYGVAAVRAATTEYLFTRISTNIQKEAERQLRAVFAHQHANVPRNLITVHIRWGDKEDEMQLLPIIAYIDGVQQILLQRNNDVAASNSDNEVNIFLATEDPRALEAFRASAPSTWNIYIDQYFIEMLPHRREQYNGSPLMSQDLNGRPGLVALGSLLVAMEANDFVLTTASNWSRLMNELRKNVLDPRCGNCTRMIDLKFGEW